MSYQLKIDPMSGLVVLPPEFWRCSKLSLKAKALFGFLCTFPSGFLPRVAEVESSLGIGRDARKACYRELRQAGLLQTRMGTWSIALKLEQVA